MSTRYQIDVPTVGITRLAAARAMVIGMLFGMLLAPSTAHATGPASGYSVPSTAYAAPLAPLTTERSTAQLEAIASVIAQQPVTIHCDDAASFAASNAADADGYVVRMPDGYVPIIHLRAYLCTLLSTVGLRAGTDRSRAFTVGDIYTPSGEPMDVPDGLAISVLAHEATHLLLRSGDEALVECTSHRATEAHVALLGLPSWLAHRLVLGERDHHSREVPPYTSDC